MRTLPWLRHLLQVLVEQAALGGHLLIETVPLENCLILAKATIALYLLHTLYGLPT